MEIKNILNKYTEGIGLDLSSEWILKNAGHVEIPHDNLFSLRELAKPESLNFIYASNISQTKFYRLIFKEMLNYAKLGGYLIVAYGENELVKYKKLKEEILLCACGKIQLVEESNNLFIFRKTKGVLEKNDSMDKWTFGIITSGKKNYWVEKQINSIREQRIPHYEIIVCGTYFDRKENNFRYIPFNEKDDLGWITKKKNLICENAKYENLCIVHDRIVLDKNWFRGMKKYGNYFEILSCVVEDEQGNRAGDWITYGNRLGKFPTVGMLEYRDWDKQGYLDGALYIIKKSVLKSAKWDETLFWNQGEDIRLSEDWYASGIITRFNPYSKCITLSWRHGDLPLYAFNSSKLGKYPISANKRIVPLIKFYIKKAIKWK